MTNHRGNFSGSGDTVWMDLNCFALLRPPAVLSLDARGASVKQQLIVDEWVAQSALMNEVTLALMQGFLFLLRDHVAPVLV